MIKTNELRRGNWLMGTRPLKVDAIYSEDQVGLAEGGNPYYVYTEAPFKPCLTPIPLTHDTLQKAGFEKLESDDDERRCVYSIQVANNTSLYYDETSFPKWYLSHEWNNNHYKNDFWGNPEYLHQLQNLFFYLTGEELEINL